MKLSTSINVLFDPPHITAVEAVQRLAKAGFERLDFNFTDWCYEGSPFVGDNWQSWIEEVLQCANDQGVEFTQAHGPIFHKFGESERQKHLTAMSHRSLEAGAILGVKWMVFEPETDNGAWDQAHLDDLKRRNVEWFGALLPTIEKTGVGLALENCTDYHARQRNCCRWYGSIPSELIALVDAFEHPLVGACWDTGHAQIQGMRQGEALRAMGARLKVVHIQDNDGREDEHLMPYYGRINWSEIIHALRDIKFTGDFTYEIHNFIRPLPNALRDEALRFSVSVGNHIINMQ